ncbi:MAG: hypothetical protein PHF37_11525, partial [Phycisphaerae bacterium]|nr:hypothetical protein [Phycisphaerae bacterium]
MRKILVVLIAFLSVLAIYLLYLRLVPVRQESADADDINIVDISGQTGNAGKIGDVEVESVEKARYVTISPETKEVEREYGFAKLLHESGSEWEIEKPYMTIFNGDSTIKFTADKGMVQLETVSNTPTPKDAALTGNVIIEIIRANGKDTTYIYLDEVYFVGEQSLFSSAGPIKVKNPRIELDGRGVKMIYNEQARRLEYLRIVELEKLNFKDILFDPASSTKDTAAENSVQPIPAGTKSGSNKPLYQLVFDRNVLINAPQQRIFTDRLSIENIIFASSSSKSKSTRAETDSDISEQTSNTIDDGFDITLSCDNGIFVRPIDSELFSLPQVQQMGDIESGGKQTLFVADKITGDMISEKLTAYRPRVDFLADNFIDPNSQSNLPVNVTCERMDFISASDRLVFEGDVRCKMTEQLPQGFRNEYTLDTPRLILNLGSKKQAESGPFAVDHVTGDNGIVQLAAAKWKDDEVFGFMKLKCYQFDYNSLGQMFIAKG